MRGAGEGASGSSDDSRYDFDANRLGLLKPRNLDRQRGLAFEAADGAIFFVVRGVMVRGAVVIGFAVLMVVVVMLSVAVLVLGNRVLGQVMVRVQPAAGGTGHQVGSQQGQGGQRMAAETEHAKPAGGLRKTPLLYWRLAARVKCDERATSARLAREFART